MASLQLPLTWDGCFEPLEGSLRQSWDAVVCVGSRESATVVVERVALNETDASVKDSLDRRPRNKKIDTNGETGYWSRLPYLEISARLNEEGMSCFPSHSAGCGVPNYLFYRLMRWIEQTGSKMMGGLVQVPNDEESLRVDRKTSARFTQTILDTLTRSSKENDSLIICLDRLRARRQIVESSLRDG